ncbi:MAG: cupredoxin family protein [Gammaproteobacteria bacterium]|nr:cupredoxin family protein [Gammaproteobacteria bacterium]
MNRKRVVMVAAMLIPFAVTAGGLQDGGHHHDAQHHHTMHGSDTHMSGGHISNVGQPVAAQAAVRSVHVDLLDTMRFAFDPPLDLKRGEAVRFIVTNRGQIRHEFSIGSADEQDAHRTMMRGMPNMMHGDPNAVTVDPGQTRELVWRFTSNGPVVFACNIPGHAEAGMVATAMLKP